MFLIFFGVITLVIGTLHFVVFKFLVDVFHVINNSSLITLRIVFVLLTFSFITASVLSSKFDTFFSRALYTFSSYWMGLLFFLFLAACLYGIVVGISFLFHANISHVQIFGLALALLAIVVSGYGAYHTNDTKIVTYEVLLPSLPEMWKGKKAVLLSDLHLGHIRGREFSEKVTSMVNKENPDIVFIAGDLFDGVKVNEKDIVAPLAALTAPWGVYYASGNHEEMRGNSNAFYEALESVGMKVLRDEKKNIEGVDIVGVDYTTTNTPQKFETVLATLGISTTPSVLIKHSPQHLEVAANAGIDLEVSGHTHRGQIVPFSYLTHKIYKGYDYGMKGYDAMQQITTSGIGSWGPPYRVGTQSEIVIITFL